ncbi:MAG TPA: hypothetical protein ENJ96_06155 [Thermodesulfatator atlanticus]|uniref:Clp1 P-loop domain-containing protein n=1 Tax=Thermodesulfatator atlanticus TaxID=501497 RepID=A0A7V5P0I6_9BACT|nr:hypothetical protein [Thermodesulfatator atlanticus]
MEKVPDSWQKAQEVIWQTRPKRVLVLGGVDTGKSSFCFFVAERLLARGVPTALLDADIGQKDVGPPTTIGLRVLEPEDLSRSRPLPAEELYFVGSTTPVGHLLPLVVGTKLLAEKSRAPITLINTTGLIRGPGVALKTFQIESLAPDLIVAFEREKELSPILDGFRHLPVLRLPVPLEVQRKDFQERRKRRETAYRRYFEGGTILEFPLKTLIIQRPRKLVPHLLCGVSDGKRHLGLALLEQVTAEGLLLFTPVPREEIKILICGSMLVRLPGVELKKLTAGRPPSPSRKRHTLPAPPPGPGRKGLPKPKPARPRRGWRRNRAGVTGRSAPQKGAQNPAPAAGPPPGSRARRPPDR